MSADNAAPDGQAVRFSRILGVRRLVAVGLTATVGLSVWALLGDWVAISGTSSVVQPFLLLALLSLPIILTYAERAGVSPGAGGPYSLARASQHLPIGFATGWVLLGGYISLLAVFAWGVGFHIDIFAQQMLGVTFHPALAASLVVIAAAANQLLATSVSWRTRVGVSFGAVAVLVILSVVGIAADPSGPAAYSRAPAADDMGIATLMMAGMWGLYFILNLRDGVQRPTRTLPKAMLTILAVTVVVGIMAALAVDNLPSSSAGKAPLLDVVSAVVAPHEFGVAIFYALFGAAILVLGLNRTIVDATALLHLMARDGHLPRRISPPSAGRGAPLLPTTVLALGAVLLILQAANIFAVGLAAAAFLWTAALVHAPDVARSRPNLPADRYPKMPFHPLLPGLVTAIGLLVPFVGLDPGVVLSGAIWVGVGAVVYVSYSRRAAADVWRREVVVDTAATGAPDAASPADTDGYRVLVCVSDVDTGQGLIRVGADLARVRGGSLLVLRTLHLPDQIPEPIKRGRAQDAWTEMSEQLASLDLKGPPARSLIRLAPMPADGIVAAAREERIDLVLLGWRPKRPPGETTAYPVLDKVLRNAGCDVAVLKGVPPSQVSRVVVATSGGPHAPTALALARDMVGPGGEISLLRLVAGDPTEEELAEAERDLADTLQAAGVGDGVSAEVVRARSIVDGVAESARKADFLLVGASKTGALEQSQFGGRAARIAFSSATATLVARTKEAHPHPHLVQFWNVVSDPLPKLTTERRDRVVKQMWDSAVPTVDFFVLITLAAAIAALGLLQDSAAVIIGAMLVAPLMAPILAMAMSMVKGDLHRLRIATGSTVQGATLAVIVGIVITIISPIDAATGEILARTEPTVLDLLVALASGAAAGYALSRAEVAAALPGVAIAAALVPPLCVVGYGIGSSNFDIAFGSSLLFITNLIAIVLAAALVFLALGFQPARSERADLVRGLRVTLISLAVVFVVLGYATVVSVSQMNRQIRIQEVLQSEVVAQAGQVREVDVRRQGDGYLVTTTIINMVDNALTTEEIAALEIELEKAAGGPVTFDATVLEGRHSRLDDLTSQRALETVLQEEVASRGGEVSRVTWTPIANGYSLEATLIAYEPGGLDDAGLAEIHRRLEEMAGSPVNFYARVTDGRRSAFIAAELNTSTPTSTLIPTRTPQPIFGKHGEAEATATAEPSLEPPTVPATVEPATDEPLETDTPVPEPTGEETPEEPDTPEPEETEPPIPEPTEEENP